MLRTALAATLVLLATSANAGNITQQQSCQVMANHVIGILESRGWKAEAAPDIAVLTAFSDGLQATIDREIADSAKQMSMPVPEIQAMVDAQGVQLKAATESRYGTEKLYRDYAVALQNCAIKYERDIGSSPEAYVAMLERIGEWAQAGR